MTEKGWIPLGLALGHVAVTLFAVVMAGVTQEPFWFDTIANLVVVGIVLGPLAMLGLYYDRRYVTSVSEWRPSVGYLFLLFVPIVGLFTTALYLYKRHHHVGVP